MNRQKSIYLDYAASTPVAPEVLAAMMPYFSRSFGNPGAPHSFGQEAQAAVDEARSGIAEFFGVDSDEILFTGSATESNNLAIRGVIKANSKWLMANGKNDLRFAIRNLLVPHIVTSAIEHESVLETCRDLERNGEAEVTYVGVNAEGFVSPEDIKKALRPETILVSVMSVNNEIGTIQPIAEIAKIIRDFRRQIANSKSQIEHDSPFAISHLLLFHTDAVQAIQYMEVTPKELGVDLLTFSGHKIYGPKGIGGLVARSKAYGVGSRERLPLLTPYPLHPIVTGGGQEFGLRSGTENVASIVGLAKALKLLELTRDNESKRISRLKQELLNHIFTVMPGAKRNGGEPSAPNIFNITLPEFSAEEIMLALDRKGLAASLGSACQAKSLQPSHVLLALGQNETQARSGLRFSLGRYTTAAEILRAKNIITEVFSSLKKSPQYVTGGKRLAKNS